MPQPVGLHEPERGVRGDRGVDGAAAALQDVEPDTGRERLARRDHPAFRHDDGAGREGVFGGSIHAGPEGAARRVGLVRAARAVYYSRL